MKWFWQKKEAAPVEAKQLGKLKTPMLEQGSVLHDQQTIKKWKAAVMGATDANNPEYTALAQLYRNLLLDGHTVANIESRLLRVQRSKFVLKNAKGEEVPEVKFLLETPWFEQFIGAALNTKFSGFRVLELWELNDKLELTTCGVIPMEHINPVKGHILKAPGDTSGWSYREGPLAPYYLQVGNQKEIGMLADLAPLILAKKLGLGSWLNFIEKFGVPGILATTDNFTTQRAQDLFDMLMAYKSNNVAVLQSNETFTLTPAQGQDPHNVFNELVKRVNSEISKRILGQDGTTDNKDASGTYGSLKILQGVADDRHESDKLFIQYIINTELLPKLQLISSAYAPLKDLVFDWDESEQMDNNTYIKNVVDLTHAGFVVDHEVVAEKTGIPITNVSLRSNTFREKEPKKKV